MKRSIYSKSAISSSFSKAASSYESFSHIQKLSNERLIKFVPQGFYKHVVEIGVGTGEFMRLLNQKIKFNSYFGVDISLDMLLEAENSGILKEKIHFICCDGENLAFEKGFKADLIVSSSSMHWFHNLIDSICYLKNNHLKKGGAMVCSIFGKNTLKELQEVIRQLKGEQILLPTFFFPNEEVLKNGLSEIFKNVKFEKITINKRYPHLIDLLLSLKKTGVAPRTPKAPVVFQTKKGINKADKLYRDLFGDVTASFEIFFFYACI